jgi:hypothetical protein
LAVLDLLCDVAAEAPLLVAVDDAHQLDRPSAAVLAFVARRIEADRIALLVATRDRHPGPLTEAGLPEHRLAPLNPAAATELLEATAPRLTAAARSRVLRESAGNPLAIIELPRAGPPQRLPGRPLPLTDRLQQTFAARVADLPAPTRWLLLAAAVDDAQHLAEVLRAGSLAAGTELCVDDLQPAAAAAIVDTRTAPPMAASGRPSSKPRGLSPSGVVYCPFEVIICMGCWPGAVSQGTV